MPRVICVDSPVRICALFAMEKTTDPFPGTTGHKVAQLDALSPNLTRLKSGTWWSFSGTRAANHPPLRPMIQLFIPAEYALRFGMQSACSPANNEEADGVGV